MFIKFGRKKTINNREIITSGDMHDIKEKYDVAIVDIPYGLYSPITSQEQKDIINTLSLIHI